MYNERRVTGLSGKACSNQTVVVLKSYVIACHEILTSSSSVVVDTVCRFLPVFLVNNVSSGNSRASCQHQHIERSSLKLTGKFNICFLRHLRQYSALLTDVRNNNKKKSTSSFHSSKKRFETFPSP